LFFLFILGCAILVLGLIGALASQKVSVALGAVALFLCCWVGASAGTVDTKNVGVVTSFKKPTGEVKGAGPYFKAPWKSVTDMSLAWQTKNYQFEVQAAGGATVGLDVRPRWRMVAGAAPELFQDYKDFDGVINNLFKTELVDASNELFSAYNPLTSYDVKTSLPLKSKEVWASELLTELRIRLAGKIEFDRLAITTIAPDTKSQEKLNQQIEEFGRGKVLDQALANAEKERQITAKNSQVDNATRCLEVAKAGGGEPGLCGSFVNGGGSTGVILNKNK
jgi:regulator of protease activity HflC (stomatin/prohibitin superfamily)